MKKIAIVDSWGSNPLPYYEEIYPNATFTHADVRSSGGRTHNHGAYVAYLALSQIPKEEEVEIFFVRVFNGDARPINNFSYWMDAVKEYAPDAITCSWGSDDADNKSLEDRLRRQFGDDYRKRIEGAVGSSALFAASGNSDESFEGDLDLDNDVGFPWRTLGDSENIAIIGAMGRNNAPAYFSSDGPEVTVSFPGEGIVVPDPVKGGQASINGTSFATPIAASHYVAGSFKNMKEWKVHVEMEAFRHPEWDETQKHPKVGWGNMSHEVDVNIDVDTPAIMHDFSCL